MELSLVLGFITATLALALMPGPDNIYVLTESVSKGWRQGVGITAGLMSGVIIHTTLVATGVSLILIESDTAFDFLKYLGAAYLLYLAYGAFNEKPMDVHMKGQAKTEPFLVIFKRGFLMNVLNPKVSIFFIALLPQFVSSPGFSPMYQMMILGFIFMLVSFVVFSSIALISGRTARLIEHKAFWTTTKWVKVVLLISLTLLLVFIER
ncbi:MAG TPA: lysine transporter LysE [Flavobacteriales bacterium]|nr:LysE family translocator [Salibacteraceae bacterium]MDB9710351.1 LysE family translocator [Salibacteraceae bacterium]HAQ70209.1 lysine transporter LysE [Flavobacteriales bacterium]